MYNSNGTFFTCRNIMFTPAYSLPPANEVWGKVMFLHQSVCLQGFSVLSRRVPSLADGSILSRGVSSLAGGAVLGRGVPWRRILCFSRGWFHERRCHERGWHEWIAVKDPLSVIEQVDGMHPTGMHSCFKLILEIMCLKITLQIRKQQLKD